MRCCENAEKLDLAPEHTPRALNREFENKLTLTVIRRSASNLFLPAPVTSALAVIRSAKYIKEGLLALWHRKLSVAVLDATAVTVSMVRGDFATAGSVMFMLRLGEILEEWTHKKSVADLASAMSLRVENVWQQVDGTEVLTKVTDVKRGTASCSALLHNTSTLGIGLKNMTDLLEDENTQKRNAR